MDKSQPQYLIGELAAQAGVSIRTVRYYIDEGLLPSPQIRGRYAFYTQDDLVRLNFIRRLKVAYLPLQEIRRQLETLSIDEVKDLLEQYESDLPNEVDTDGSEIDSEPAPATLPPAPPKANDPDHALDYIARLLSSPGGTGAGRPQGKNLRQPAAKNSETDPQVRSVDPEPRKRIIPPRAGQPEPMDLDGSDTSWTRVNLAPGLELHVHQPVSPDLHQPLQSLLEFARILFAQK